MTGLTTHFLPGGVPLPFDDEDDEESSGWILPKIKREKLFVQNIQKLV